MSNSLQRLRHISHQYARRGDKNDFDEFRKEMRRVDRKQRHQILERYINDLYNDYPHIVRNRYHQFVPVRNDRLTYLIRAAMEEQKAANEALKMQNSRLEQEVKDMQVEIEQSLADSEEDEKSVLEPNSKPQTTKSLDWQSHLPQILIFVGLLLSALLLALIYSVTRLSALANSQQNKKSDTANKADRINAKTK